MDDSYVVLFYYARDVLTITVPRTFKCANSVGRTSRYEDVHDSYVVLFSYARVVSHDLEKYVSQPCVLLIYQHARQ